MKPSHTIRAVFDDPNLVSAAGLVPALQLGAAPTPHEATLVPPRHERIRAAIDDLPLIPQAAIAHAQVETIHPVADGNGRLGRALIHAALSDGGATTRTVLPISAGLLSDTGGYIAALTAYRDGDPNAIVAALTGAAFQAVTMAATSPTTCTPSTPPGPPGCPPDATPLPGRSYRS